MKYAGGHGGRRQLLEDEERRRRRRMRSQGCRWIGVKGMRLEARHGRGLPRIISFNYSKMSGWITSYFFLELTFNGLSALTAITDSFYILPLGERKRTRTSLTSSSTSLLVFGCPIKIDRGRILDRRYDNLSSPEPRTILRNRRASQSRCSQKLAVREIDYAMFAKVWLLATLSPRANAHPQRYLCSLTARCVVNLSDALSSHES